MVDPARRAWLKGDFGRRQPAIRPPGATGDATFIRRCTRCDDCIRACPDGLLGRGDGGFPEMSFRYGGCDACLDCVRACRTGALDASRLDRSYQVSVAGNCLSMNGVTCRVCGESCEQSAIRFRLVVGGHAQLQIEPGACNGCGACIGVCPVTALSLVRSSTKETA